MISFYTIMSIARYEARVLFRSWFFRIFLLLTLLILVLLNIAFFIQPRSAQWAYYGMASGIPYMNILLLNLAQALIGGFLASDFLKYDRRLDTTDVIYIRSMTNADYVAGKVLGILAIFGGLNLLVLGIAASVNVFFTETPFVWQAYLWLPLLISLPTLLFILGASFLCMLLLRSQAITFILLIGYFVITIFFTGRYCNNLFDYLAFDMPLLYSDFTGFGEITELLLQRSLYVVAGCGMICATILLIRRLPQSRVVMTLVSVCGLLCIAGAGYAGFSYYRLYQDGRGLRMEMKAANSRISAQPFIRVNACRLQLDHDGYEIDATAALTVANPSDTPIIHYVLSLNPGLTVESVHREGRTLPFQRELHLLTITPDQPLGPGEEDQFTIVYQGAIDEHACYVDIEESVRDKSFRHFLYTIRKHYSFITPRYVLLTHENLWYPVSGIPAGMAYPAPRSTDFTRFTLTVQTQPDLIALSQGAVQETGPGAFAFLPEQPLPQLSLIIGDYRVLSVNVDDVTYSLYYRPGHDHFRTSLGDMEEDIPELIRALLTDYQSAIELSFPYPRLSLIEVPIQFHAYPRFWTISAENVQPEQVFLPERGVTLASADFKRFAWYEERNMQRGRETASPEEIKKNLFRRFVRDTFLEQSGQSAIFSAMRRSRSGFLSSRALSVLGGGSLHSYSLLPLYYSYVHHITSDRWPIFNTMMEYHYLGKIEGPPSRLMRMIQGLSNEEQANLVLAGKSLADICANPGIDMDVYEILKLKCSFLFKLLQSKTNQDDFSLFLQDFLLSRRFTDMPVDTLLSTIDDRFTFDLSPYLDDWLHATQLPAFHVTNQSCIEILDIFWTRYQVRFTVSNPEPVDGLIEAEFLSGGGSRFEGRGGGGFSMFGNRGESASITRIIEVPAGKTLDVSIVLDERPRMMTINTLVSRNIPASISTGFGRIETSETIQPVEAVAVLDSLIVPAEAGAIIVDNEDLGFTRHAALSEGYLKKLIGAQPQNQDAYAGMNFRRPPNNWTAITSDSYYGLYRHSAHYIKAGRGDNSVSWTATLPQAGWYHLWYYVSPVMGGPGFGPGDSHGRRSGGERGFRYSDGGPGRGGPGYDYHRMQEDLLKEFNFRVEHGNGVDDAELDVEDAENGWNLLSTYYFDAGPATVELSDFTRGRLVYADAVKWTRRK